MSDERDLLYYNPANYVVDVIGEGRAATMGSMAAAIPAQQSMWRQLEPGEVTLLNYSSACARAAQGGNHQKNATETVTDFSCFGMRFLQIIRGGTVYYYVANHPAVIRPTGLAMNPIPHLTPTTPVQPHQMQPSPPQTPVQPRQHPTTPTMTPVQPRPLPTKTDKIPVTPRPLPTTPTMTPARGGAPAPSLGESVNNEGTDEDITDYGMGAVPHWFGLGGDTNDLGGDTNDLGALGDASTDQQNADAVAMNNSLADHGYKLADQYLYKAFQTDVGLTPDGFPGTQTMQELKDVLFAQGIEMANVPIYPWLANCAAGSGDACYDGINAPLLSDWAPGSTASPPPPALPPPPNPNTLPTTVVTGSASKSNAGIVIIGATAAAVASVLGWRYYKKHRR